MRLKIVLIIILCGIITFTSNASGNDQTISVSLVHLLVDPEEFEGNKIQVAGYLKQDITLELYLTKEHADSSDTMSSILVSDTKNGDIWQSKCLSSFVKLTGFFVKRYNSPGFIIQNVDSIYNPYSSEICWSRTEKDRKN